MKVIPEILLKMIYIDWPEQKKTRFLSDYSENH